MVTNERIVCLTRGAGFVCLFNKRCRFCLFDKRCRFFCSTRGAGFVSQGNIRSLNGKTVGLFQKLCVLSLARCSVCLPKDTRRFRHKVFGLLGKLCGLIFKMYGLIVGRDGLFLKIYHLFRKM